MDLLKQVDQPQVEYTVSRRRRYGKKNTYKSAAIKTEAEQPLDPFIRHIPLTMGQHAIVDAHLYEWLTQWNWHAIRRKGKPGQFYAGRGILLQSLPIAKAGVQTMHREIVGLYIGNPRKADHADRNGLHNTGANLRYADSAQNAHNCGMRSSNESGYIGVTTMPKRKSWKAGICVRGKTMFLGYFKQPETAARIRDAAARKYHGAFAVLNFPDE